MTEFKDDIRVAQDIFLYLQSHPNGEVILTTSKGIYLQFSSRIILLTMDKYGITPIGLGLSRFVDFVKVIAPQEGQKVEICGNEIRFPSGFLNANWLIETPKIQLVDIKPAQIVQCADQLVKASNQRSAAKLAAPLLLGETEFPLESLCQRALPDLIELTACIRAENAPGLDAAVQKLLGLGFGLTPSFDDVLLGLLFGLLRLSPHEPSTATLQAAISRHAPNCTNAISSAYLSAIAQGSTFSLLEDILTNLGNDTTIDITPILQIGSSSGSEMLLGLLLAAKLTMKG